jgi:hypothetical protein
MSAIFSTQMPPFFSATKQTTSLHDFQIVAILLPKSVRGTGNIFRNYNMVPHGRGKESQHNQDL